MRSAAVHEMVPQSCHYVVVWTHAWDSYPAVAGLSRIVVRLNCTVVAIAAEVELTSAEDTC